MEDQKKVRADFNGLFGDVLCLSHEGVIDSLRLMLVIVAAALSQPMLANAQVAMDKWQVYRSEVGGFEVNYPTDWSVSTENKGNSLVVFFTSPRVRDDDVFQAARIVICSTPINETAWNDCTERDSHLSELYKDAERSRKEFVVSGFKVERVETSSKYDDGFFYYARFSADARKLFVRGNFKKLFNLDRYAPVFDKMLESLCLLSAAHNEMHPTSNSAVFMRPAGRRRYFVRGG